METLAEGGIVHSNWLHVSLPYSFLFSFFCRNNIVAVHVILEQVYSSGLYIKNATWSCCVSVFDSFGELAAPPGIDDSGNPDGFGTVFEVGRTSCDGGANIRMVFVSNLCQDRNCISWDSGWLTSLLCFRSGWRRFCAARSKRRLHGSEDEEAEKIKECRKILKFSLLI